MRAFRRDEKLQNLGYLERSRLSEASAKTPQFKVTRRVRLDPKAEARPQLEHMYF